MAQSTIAIIVLFAALILYMIPRIPLSVTALISMLIMGFTGCCSWSQAFSGFSNNAVLLSAGMMVIGQACISTGIAARLGSLLYRFVRTDRIFITMVFVLAALISVFINGALTVALMAPIVDSVVLRSEGRFRRKQAYMPLGIAATLGNNLTTVSATSMITCVALLIEAGFEEMNLFTPMLVNLPGVLICALIFWLFGEKMEKKWYDFEEVPVEAGNSHHGADYSDVPVWKQWLTAAVLIGVVAALVCGVNTGAAPLVGAVILIASGCITEKEAYRGISWTTIILMSSTLGFSAGFSSSGAGEVVADAFISLSGPLASTGFGMCIVMFIIACILTNLMSDNATIAILTPISIAIAGTLQIDALPIVLCAASGAKVGIATPMSVTPMAMIQVPGYRFKDYFRCGGLVNLVCMFSSLVAVYLIYYI